RPVVRIVEGDLARLFLALDVDLDRPRDQRLPATVISVLQRVLRIQRKHVDVRRVRASRGHGPGDVVVVPETDIRAPGQGETGTVKLARVNPQLPETLLAPPGKVRINDENRRFHRGAAGRNGHFIGGAHIDGEIRSHSRGPQLGKGLTRGPAPHEVAAVRYGHG